MIPLILVDTKVKTTKRGTVSVEVMGRSSFEVRVDGHVPHGLKLGWWDDLHLGAFEEFIRRGQLQLTTLEDGLEEITTHDVKGRLAHLRAQHSDFVILREVCASDS